jgi:thiamine-phosphate pyrophosphorylase
MAPHQHEAAAARKLARRRLVAAARLSPERRARNGAPLPRAIFMTDPGRTPDPARIAAQLPAGWGVIYRHFGAKDRFEVGERLARICRSRRLVLLVSADLSLARRIGADGVHWPEKLMSRRRAAPGLIETASAHSRLALARAARQGMDAAILSTVFASGSASASRPMGAIRFRLLARGFALPVYALGGIGPDNAARAMTGAAGWAAVEAIAMVWGTGGG